MRSFLRKTGRVVWPRGRWRWPLRGLIIMLPLSLISVEVTSLSSFCRSCHIMEPYYDSWAHGSHKDIACVDCHIAPGVTNFVEAKLNGLGQVVDDLLHRTSTKPSASVSDMACTRSGCHGMETVRKSKNQGKYLFDHGKHLDLTYSGIPVHCTTCHSHVKGDEHFELNTNACVTCHLTKPSHDRPDVMFAAMTTAAPPATRTVHVPEGKRAPSECKSCHVPPSGTIEYRGLKINHGEYLSYGASCESCHNGVTEKPRPIRSDACFSCHEFGLERHTDVEDTHKVHSGGRHKVECFSCHGETAHGPKAQAVQVAQLDCTSCHQSQHAVQQKTYTTVIAPTTTHVPPIAMAPHAAGAVSPMFLVHVSCGGCHVEPRPVTAKPGSGAMVLAASKSACDNCHKTGVGDLVTLWQKNTRELFDGVSKMLPPERPEMSPLQRQIRGEAQFLLELVRQDGSWGVHNPKYTQKLLDDAQAKIVELEHLTLEEAEP